MVRCCVRSFVILKQYREYMNNLGKDPTEHPFDPETDYFENHMNLPTQVVHNEVFGVDQIYLVWKMRQQVTQYHLNQIVNVGCYLLFYRYFFENRHCKDQFNIELRRVNEIHYFMYVVETILFALKNDAAVLMIRNSEELSNSVEFKDHVTLRA